MLLTSAQGTWRNLDDAQDQQEPFGLPWTLHFAFARIAEYQDQLPPQALQHLAQAVPKRQREFATGRHLAALALAASGSAETTVGKGQGRAPQWPAARIGSISHTNEFAWAVVGHLGPLVGLGIDLERLQRLQRRLFDTVFTPAELQQYDNQNSPPCWADLVFSAKEAIYKAVNPINGRYIGFKEVEVDLLDGGKRFRVRYMGSHQPNKIMDAGQGFATTRGDHVLTLFALTDPAAQAE